ncbi:MAG: ribonuclease HII [Bacilli bacterium]
MPERKRREPTGRQAACIAAWEYDQAARAEFGPVIGGVDEAGRGPLAGPVVAAAVVLPDSLRGFSLYDSKKLSAADRAEAYEIIRERAVSYGIGVVDHAYVDRHNVLQATYEAMRQAVSGLRITPGMLLVDGALIPRMPHAQRRIVRGDQISQSIGAASILAKVTRDRWMVQMDAKFPGYGFARHMGYGTPQHLEALANHGPCAIHRMTFAPVREAFLRRQGSAPTADATPPAPERTDARRAQGARGEEVAVAALLAKGYRLLERNWRVRAGEIDAVMADGDMLVFVEIRSRTGQSSEAALGAAADSVNARKQHRLRCLAQVYEMLNTAPPSLHTRFDVVAVSFDDRLGAPIVEHYIDAF